MLLFPFNCGLPRGETGIEADMFYRCKLEFPFNCGLPRGETVTGLNLLHGFPVSIQLWSPQRRDSTCAFGGRSRAQVSIQLWSPQRRDQDFSVPLVRKPQFPFNCGLPRGETFAVRLLWIGFLESFHSTVVSPEERLSPKSVLFRRDLNRFHSTVVSLEERLIKVGCVNGGITVSIQLWSL